MSDVLGQFLGDIGFGGAQTGADIVRMLGVQDRTLQKTFGQGLEPLIGTVRKGLGELPGLLSTLTGQAQTVAGLGRERIGRVFEAGRTGLEERGIELGRASQMGRARAGFAGGGAIEREERLGRRHLGQQFMEILGARRTGLGGVEAGLKRSLFGAGERVESERAGLLGALGGGIQNLLNALIAGGVQFGGGDRDGDGDRDIPVHYLLGVGETTVLGDAYEQYRRSGGAMNREDWRSAGMPANVDVSGEPGAYRGGGDIGGYYEERYADRLT